MLPEEQELNRLESEQATLEDQVATAELTLETLKAETAQFQYHYHQIVGRLFAELDRLVAQIARAEAGLDMDNAEAQTQAEAAEQQAQQSAEEAGVTEKQPPPPPEITPELKQAFRQAAKLMHPDRATTKAERERRTTLIAKVNVAYAEGNQIAIEKLILEFGQDPEAITGGDVAARLVKTIRRIAQLRRRIAEAQLEIAAQKAQELHELMITVTEAKELGGDPLDDLAKQIMQQISEHKIKLETIWQCKVSMPTKLWNTMFEDMMDKETGIALTEQDVRYRQARDIYNRITEYGYDVSFYSEAIPKREKQSQQLADAFSVFQQLADQGYGKAYFPLARMYWGGQGISQNIQKANYYSRLRFEWCFANQALSDPEIWVDLGLMYANGCSVEQNDEQAVFWYRKAAEQGHAYAQYNLGWMYDQGLGVEQDYEQAVFWCRKAAEQSYAQAQYTLGSMYEQGRVVEQDYEQAVFWYRKAAEQGHVHAQCNLGWMYEQGCGVEQDDDLAVFWNRKAAEQGDALAQCNLGSRYELGCGVVQDYEQAVFWYDKAIHQRHAQAQYNLGRMYANGHGVEQNYKLAVSCYYDAAQQGHAQAQYSLGRMHFDGQGVEQEDEMAVFWWRKAAQRGHAQAQFSLGCMYQQGRSVEQDYEQAVFLWRMAAAQGDASAQKILTSCNIKWDSA